MMRNWIAERLESLAARLRTEKTTSWGALVDGENIVIQRGQQVHLNVEGNVAVDVDAVAGEVIRLLDESLRERLKDQPLAYSA